MDVSFELRIAMLMLGIGACIAFPIAAVVQWVRR